jgi:hypothetical protein
VIIMALGTTRLGAYRPIMVWGSAIGLGLVAILASVSVARRDHGFALAVAAITGWPFVLGMLALFLNARVTVQRWLLLIAAVGAAVLALPLIFNGTGWWFGLVAIAYAWAWWGSRSGSS